MGNSSSRLSSHSEGPATAQPQLKVGGRPARLLIVVNDPGFFLSHRLALALAAKAAGADVHVATGKGEAARRIRAIGFPFHALPISRRGMAVARELQTTLALVALYRKIRPDLVHHVTIKPVLYGSVAARVAKVPAVVNAVTGLGYLFTAGGARTRILRMVARRMYRVAFRHPHSRVIFQNPDDRARFVTDELLEEKASVLIRGSGVDLVRFHPRPEPDTLPTVVLASRMLWQKGIAEFVGAARHLRAQGVAGRFVLVGDTDPGNPTAIPRRQLAAWDAEGLIEWWGHRGDMPEVFAQAHIVCLASQYGEGVPKVLIEAAASGRPIVTTDAPGCREVVRHGENGLLVRPGDVPGLAEALRRLIESPRLRSEMGARGREIAAEEFSVERVVTETVEVYAELLRSIT